MHILPAEILAMPHAASPCPASVSAPGACAKPGRWDGQGDNMCLGTEADFMMISWVVPWQSAIIPRNTRPGKHTKNHGKSP